jgi:hypothetical protein
MLKTTSEHVSTAVNNRTTCDAAGFQTFILMNVTICYSFWEPLKVYVPWKRLFINVTEQNRVILITYADKGTLINKTLLKYVIWVQIH